ncbi:hypothetical protein DPMN_081748 [Dreissena polymorpha]|uniref:Uncharacterized protein n=1 Tax=Dreissena polymorpha TaxID=45954 RepID=A0A9D3Y5L2_DREPO|nr:hypothetical protein DPMN_081748 [Dreissena polymorpha]
MARAVRTSVATARMVTPAVSWMAPVQQGRAVRLDGLACSASKTSLDNHLRRLVA